MLQPIFFKQANCQSLDQQWSLNFERLITRPTSHTEVLLWLVKGTMECSVLSTGISLFLCGGPFELTENPRMHFLKHRFKNETWQEAGEMV